MTKKIAVLLLSFILTACNGLGPKRVKNIVELTPRLSVQTNTPIYLDSDSIYSFNSDIFRKNKEYNFTKKQTITEPVFVDNMVYALDIRANISAFSRNTNKIIWSYNLSKHKKDNYNGGGILHHNGKLYVTYGSRILVVLDAKSGYEILRKELADIIKVKPVIIDNNIVVQTINNQVIALDKTNLNPVWQHEGMLEFLSSNYFATPLVYRNLVIVTYTSGQIFAINNKNGEVVWNFEFTDPDNIAIPNFEEASILCPSINDGHNLYIASGIGKLIKLNIETGKVIWQIKANDIQSMTLVGNNLFITNNARQLAAIGTDFGEVKFVADLNSGIDLKKLKSAIFLAPLVSKDQNGEKSLNIISVNGILYSFKLNNNGSLATTPITMKIIKNIQYYGLDANNNMYFATNRKIIFN